MSDHLKKIDEVIQGALTEKTFSLEIIDKIKEIKDRLVLLEEENITLTKELEEGGKAYRKLDADLDKAREEIKIFKEKEKELVDREKEVYKKEINASASNEKSLLVIDLFKTVFKNTEFKSEMFRNVNINKNDYSENGSITETKTETKE